MGVTTEISPSGQTIYKTSDTGFWASYDPRNEKKPLRGIGYNQATVRNRYPIVLTDALFLMAYGGKEFSAFLMTIYKAGLHISEEGVKDFNLHRDIVKAGNFDYSDPDPANWKDSYGEMKPLDFMVLTGAIIYPEIMTHIPSAENPTPPARPEIYTLPKGDSNLMFMVIKHLGMWGVLQHLFLKGGITFQEFKTEIRRYLKTEEERRNYYGNVLNKFLVYNNYPLWSDSMINTFIENEE